MSPDGQNHSNNASHKRQQEVNRGGETGGMGMGREGGREGQGKTSERNRLASVLRCMSNNQDDNELKLSGNKTI